MIDYKKEYRSKDLNKLNFHDAKIRSIIFGKKNISSMLLKIDYIIKATHRSGKFYSFLISKADLEFLGISNLIINLDFKKFSASTLEIDEISMNEIKNRNQFTIDTFMGTTRGTISFDADDFILKFKKPKMKQMK